MNDMVPLRSDDFPLENCYIAVPLPATIQSHLASVLSNISLPDNVRIQTIQTAHITFQFLGLVHQNEFTYLLKMLREFLHEVKPFMITLGGLGSFSHGKRHVLYIRAESPDLVTLQRQWLALSPSTAPNEVAYTPHLTLARARGVFPLDFFNTLKREAEEMRFYVNSFELCARYRGIHQTTLLVIPF
jgi:2'-5' RNA ligase